MAEFTAALNWPSFPDVQSSHAVALVPVRWAAEADGGPSEAEIRVNGTEGSLADVARMLGAHVTISNELGSPVFWGYVHETEMRIGGQMASLSLSDVYNKIAVAYTVRQPDNSERRFTTDWETWSVTATLYGIREMLDTLNDGDSTAAEKMRDRLLYRYARCMPSFTSDGGAGEGVELTLYCRGYWDLLDVQYYAQPKGLEENASPRKGQQIIGAYYTATTISFATEATEDNDIRDSANGLAALQEGTPSFWVSGATNAANNGKRNVSDFDTSGHIECVEKTMVSEAAGATVTLSWDEQKTTHVAQSFVAGSAFEVRKISVRASRTGTVADNLRLAIWSDSAGSPNAELCYGGVTGSTMATDIGWVEAVTTTGTSLAAGTTYWVVAHRHTDTPSLDGYYTVGMDENLYYTTGAVKVKVGGSWVARTVDADMPFRVTGLEDTALQLANMINIADDGGVIAAVQEISSGIETWQYRDGDRTILDEMKELMALGTASGGRLCAQVESNRYVRIYNMPTTPTEAMRAVLTERGKLEDAEPGYLPAGRWIRLGSQSMTDAIGQDLLFVERCEYDAETDSLSVEGESTVSAWRAFGNRKG
jgi:hypothetical protein